MLNREGVIWWDLATSVVLQLVLDYVTNRKVLEFSIGLGC